MYPQEAQIDLVELIHQPEWKSILIDLVRTEKMDPWAIDIAELADKYLQKINSIATTNLRIPANAVLASAILLKFKAKKLHISSIQEEDEELLQKELQLLSREEKRLFEAVIPELMNPRAMREARVSLDALVDAIGAMLQRSKQKRLLGEARALEFAIPFSEKTIEEKLALVLELVKQNVDSTGLVLFSALAAGKKPQEVVDIFIPLLFLSNKETVNMWQEDFFGEIFISIVK